MAGQLYRVVFEGEILEGIQVQEVKRALAKLYNTGVDQVERFFYGKRLEVKKDVDYETAMKYVKAFERAGAVCRVEELNTEDEGAAKEATCANPHVLWRQVVGFLFWTGLLSFLAGGIPLVVMGLALGGVTFADAWKSGIYKNPDKKSFLNISPMAWGIAMALLFIVAYPTYLISRNKLRTVQAGNGFFVAVIIVGAVVIAQIVLKVLVQRGVIVV